MVLFLIPLMLSCRILRAGEGEGEGGGLATGLQGGTVGLRAVPVMGGEGWCGGEGELLVRGCGERVG